LSFLVDTNVLSEVRKQRRAAPSVRSWWEQTPQEQIFVSVLVLGEIRAGVERVRRRDAAQADALAAWHDEVALAFRDRLLDIDAAIADRWGRLVSARPLPPVDALLAATAIVHGLTLVTRNVRDVAGTGVALLDPFLVD
jgi:predicted nucleic acid-binding protein